MNLPDDASLLVGLSAVIVAADAEQPYVLATRQGDAGAGLPFGPFDPSGHRTFELGLRDWVTAQTGFELGYVEQLYTFGDRGRELPRADYPNAPENARIICSARRDYSDDDYRDYAKAALEEVGAEVEVK